MIVTGHKDYVNLYYIHINCCDKCTCVQYEHPIIHRQFIKNGYNKTSKIANLRKIQNIL